MIATCSGAKKHVVLGLGADLAVDYKAVPVFSEPVLDFTHGKGVDLIFDPIMSGPHFNEVSVS